MNFNNQKLFIPYKNLILTQKTLEGKNNCFYFYGENVSFIETLNFLNFRKQYIKHVFVPTIVKPRSFLTPEYRKVLRDRKLIPVKGRLGEYSKLHGFNFYFDGSRYLNTLDSFYRIQRYNTGYGAKLYREYLNTIEGIDKNIFDTTLLYAVNLDKPVATKFQLKRNYILYQMLFDYFKGDIKKLPFEKILLFMYTKDSGRFIKLFDVKAPNNNLVRVRKILMSIQQMTDNATLRDNDIEHMSTVASNETQLVSNDKQNVIASAVKTYFKAEPNVVLRHNTFKNPDQLVTKAVVYNMVGNIEKAEKIAKTIESKPIRTQKQIIKQLSSQILHRPPAQNNSTNLIIKSIDVPKILDYQSPEHIFQKRTSDFKEHLPNDIKDAFGILEKKDIPLKVKSLKLNVIETGASEIYKTIKDRYDIILEDSDGQEHAVSVDVPHLTSNGSFLVNGQQKILVNQILRFPIFFPSVNVARFESSYSVMKIHSKELTTGSYLILFMGSYKLPLIMFLAYRYGLTDVLKEYGVTYTIN